jgi:hypothetical protein
MKPVSAARMPVTRPANVSQYDACAQNGSEVARLARSLTTSRIRDPTGKVTSNGCSGWPAIAALLGVGSRSRVATVRASSLA